MQTVVVHRYPGATQNWVFFVKKAKVFSLSLPFVQRFGQNVRTSFLGAMI